ncbi:unnamed protein product [Rotaria socialis]|uniref:Uncharacterized protein n=3 Tax=Rotaria socialis TaxID=392032 RepID=A0A817QRL6_9BILA|nr:unnamed protein product [Rotaria socialis]CAF3684523.1 unnamed protein product [Rotaria socialis]CAF3755381.1 unnamed protein product [Rotaria socialis]CAF4157856.1 unnamed protein product [Rotaria socialis]CAF4409775.1 unnamed protein product [Rotaria socialis]
MTQSPTDIVPNKSQFSTGPTCSSHTCVTFHIDETHESSVEAYRKQPTRNNSPEPFVANEIRSWSSFTNGSVVKQVLGEFDKKASNKRLQQMNAYRTSKAQEKRSNRSRSALIDRKKYYYRRHSKLTCYSFCGTMSNVNEIFTCKQFLRGHPCLQTLFIFIDSCFRGMGQVMFANNPLSGFVITIGLMVGQWQLALYGLFGTIVSTLTAHIIGLDYRSIRAGLYGYNGCLTAMAIAHFSFGPNSAQSIVPIALMSACSSIFLVAIGKILVDRLGLSPFTFSSQLCSFIWLLGALKSRYFFVNGTFWAPESFTTFAEKLNLSNMTAVRYSSIDIVIGFPTSISEIYFIDSAWTGIIILVGILICSPVLAFFALFGAITGQLSAACLLGLPTKAIHMGLWGYNSALVCQALGGMFFVLSGCHIWLFILFGSVLTVLVQAAISTLFSPIGMPALMLPSTLICWMFCLMAGSSKNMVAVKLTDISIPEEHLRRFRLTNLVKTHFEFLNNLSTILEKTGHDEDISVEDLAKIEAEFVPILLCSYAHQNDLRNLKTLLNEGADVNSTDYDLRSPLHLAACAGNTEVCLMLIRMFRANVNMIDEFGGTPLYDAFCHGNFHLISFLYALGARMPVDKAKELTFYLCVFAFEGNLEAVQYLIACGVNPNLTDYNGRTALHLAVCSNHISVVKYLVEECNSSLTIVDVYLQTPIQEARSLPDTHIANYLQRWRDNSSKITTTQELDRILEDMLDQYDNDGPEEEEDGKDESFINHSSVSIEESLLPALFCTAAAEGDVRQMADFLEQFPEFCVNSVDYDFRSAAHVAAAEGQLRSIQFLYQYSYSRKQDLSWIYREDRWGFTSIEEAFRYGHYEVANYLIECVRNGEKVNTTDIARRRSSTIKPVLASMNQWRKVLRFATLASENEAELINGLLASGVFSPLELYADYDGRSPMHFAAANGNLDVIKVLLRYGYDGKTHKDRWGNCALDEARRKKFAEIVDLLNDDIV